jgi:hypothetical protein
MNAFIQETITFENALRNFEIANHRRVTHEKGHSEICDKYDVLFSEGPFFRFVSFVLFVVRMTTTNQTNESRRLRHD